MENIEFIWGYTMEDINYEVESGMETFNSREEALKSAEYNFWRGGFDETPETFILGHVKQGKLLKTETLNCMILVK